MDKLTNLNFIMKKIYYLLITLAISSLSFGQEVFNLPGGGTLPAGWTATNNVTSQPIEQSTYFLLDSGDPSDIIESPVYDLSAYSSATFSLDVATFGPGDNNSAKIEFSYDGGTTYTQSETSAVATSSTYIAGGVFAVTPSAQVMIKLTNSGISGKGNRLRNLVLTGASASPLQITTSVCATATSVRLTGPWWSWDPTGGPEAVSNNDGTWTFTFDPAPTENMEYLLVVDGIQENLISIMANGGTCAPVTDSASYANRQWILDSGDVTNNYGQCGTTCVAPVITLIGGDVTITVGDTYTDAGATASDDEQGDITGDILGITDLDTSVAGEYTVAYNVSDGALNAATEVVRTVTVEAAGPAPLQITTSVCATATSVRLTGPWWGWDPTGGPEAVSNNDGTWTFTLDPAPTANMEYLLVVDGVQENLISIMANGGTCAPVTDTANYANRQWILDSGDVTNNYGQCGTTCVAPVITLLGGDETITVGDTYTDAGATASDDEQGDITSDILGITDLDTSVAGEYTVAYNVSDGALNAATEVVRTVTVEEANVTSFPYCSSFDTDLGDWSTEATQGTSNWESASSSNNSVAAYSGGGSAYYYSGNYNGDSSVLISRPMDITALASPQVTFQIANPSWGADQDVLEVWYKATAADAWSVLGTYTDATTTFSEVTLNLPNASNDYYIAFNATSGYGYGVLIDDVCIAEGPSCLDPTDLAVADITTTTASVSWTADSSQTAWEYQVVAGGATPAETGDATSDNPLALTGLTSNTTYDVYVRANCGTDGTSEWVMVSFITECDAVTAFPYTEDFDTDWSCWSVNNADGDNYTWSQSDTYITPRSGDFTAHGMGSNNDYLISPKFSLTGNERVVWYDIVESANNNNTYDVLLSTTGKEISDFTVNLGTYDCTNETWTEHILDLSAYTGDVYIALHQTYSAATYYGFGVDDFTVMENPSCIDPTDVTVADVTINNRFRKLDCR